ncbi:hypothetical protein B6F84_04650 [Acidianus manzaensis]|uniref:Amino acid permease/ SLC12A domain-containing protein n=2 Tax=Acidianus manzaensis TaxID=282676 RepID=A0A1W6K3G3_9CREN|nr:hypothetical protein B6F84_04650 [Acidianus manzaensis]
MKKQIQEYKLKHNAVGLMHGIFQSISHVSPAGDVAILLTGTVAYAGAYSALAVLIAWLIYGMWMNTPYQFSKLRSNAGGYYAYASLGSKILSIPTFLSYTENEMLGGPAFGILGFASFFYLISPSITAIPYIWIAFASFVAAYGFIISYLGIKESLSYAFYTGIAEVLFLGLASIAIIFRLGSLNTFTVFSPPTYILPLVFLGMVFSILDFTGLGTVITVSEEIKEPKKNIGRSIIYAFLLTGFALILPAYALTVGWGLGNISTFATSPDPGLIIFGKYLGIIGFILLTIFVANSYLSFIIANSNVVSRIAFSASRDGVLLPKWFYYTHPKRKTPVRTLMLWLGVGFGSTLISGLVLGPFNGALLLLTISGIGVIFEHIFANIGLTIFAKKQDQFDVFKHGFVPIVSSILGVVVLYYSMQGLISTAISSPSLLNYALLGAGIFAILWPLAVGFSLSVYYMKKHPEKLAKAGEYDIEMELKPQSKEY